MTFNRHTSDRLGRWLLTRWGLVTIAYVCAALGCTYLAAIDGPARIEAASRPAWAISSRVATRNVLEGKWKK